MSVLQRRKYDKSRPNASGRAQYAAASPLRCGYIARTMSADIDTLTIQASAHEDVQADKVDLLVTIRGASLVTGSAALQKAREVRQLVDELSRVGVPERAIRLLSVTAETSTSVIGKSSSASYELCVRCDKLDSLADVLGVVTGQKNTQLKSMAWDYPDLGPIHDALLRRCLARASAKAELMADALNSRIDRVHSAQEVPTHAPDSPYARTPVPMASAMDVSRARMSSDDLGLAVTHTKRISAQVEVVYRISPRRIAEDAA